MKLWTSTPFLPVVPAALALVGALMRWWSQGSGNNFTALHKRFYVRDPVIDDWVELATDRIWIGLELCAVVLAVVCGLAIGGWVIRRVERKRERPAKVLRSAAWMAALVPLALPIAAFASGGRPSDAVDLPPTDRGPTTAASSGIAGKLAAPAGRYEVVAQPDATFISAQLKAGGERFDARFSRDITGWWDADPSDLSKPMRVEIKAAAAAVDTGVGPRSNSARDGYLKADKHPYITFELASITAADQLAADKIGFRAKGTLGFVGRTHAIDVTGTVRIADDALRARLGASASTGGLLLTVQADFTLVVKDTVLGEDAGDFDEPTIPIHISLVLRKTPQS